MSAPAPEQENTMPRPIAEQQLAFECAALVMKHCVPTTASEVVKAAATLLAFVTGAHPERTDA